MSTAVPASSYPLPDGSGRAFRATRSARLGARTLDGLVLSVLCFGAALGTGGLVNLVGASSDDATLGAVVVGFLAFCGILVANALLLVRSGQTIGKRLMNIEIVGTDGTRATFGKVVVLREIVPSVLGAIPVVGPLFAILNVLMIFGDERRCIHDVFADTVVLSRNRVIPAVDADALEQVFV